jgi:hypothetical protein
MVLGTNMSIFGKILGTAGKLGKAAINTFGGGELLSAGMQALGGIAGRKNERKLARNSSGWALRDTVETAKEVGIHPLAALGTVSPYTSSNPMAVGLANAGSTLAQGAAAKSRAKENAAIMASQVAVNNTQAELNAARSRTEAMEQRRIANELSATAAGPANSGGILYYGADPLSTRPEEARIKDGPHKGKYAYMLDGTIFVTGNTSPQALIEELKGSALGEITAIADTITGAENYKGVAVIDTTDPSVQKEIRSKGESRRSARTGR